MISDIQAKIQVTFQNGLENSHRTDPGLMKSTEIAQLIAFPECIVLSGTDQPECFPGM